MKQNKKTKGWIMEVTLLSNAPSYRLKQKHLLIPTGGSINMGPIFLGAMLGAIIGGNNN